MGSPSPALSELLLQPREAKISPNQAQPHFLLLSRRNLQLFSFSHPSHGDSSGPWWVLVAGAPDSTSLASDPQLARGPAGARSSQAFAWSLHTPRKRRGAAGSQGSAEESPVPAESWPQPRFPAQHRKTGWVGAPGARHRTLCSSECSLG